MALENDVDLTIIVNIQIVCVVICKLWWSAYGGYQHASPMQARLMSGA